jgi:hypothetical protein
MFDYCKMVGALPYQYYALAEGNRKNNEKEKILE